MTRLTSRLGLLIAGIILVYFVIYAIACPTKELVSAVAFEVCAFAVVIFFRLRKAGRQSDRARDAILDELSQDLKLVRKGWKFSKSVMNVILVSTIAVLILDLSALLCAAGGLFPATGGLLQTARVLYLANPIYRLPEIHPALSCELLAGALMESNRLNEAERLSHFLLDIRETIFGKKHQMVAEMYGNFSRIYLKKGEPEAAEQFSRRSIEMWRQCCGEHKLGSAYTQLGNSLRDQKRFAEATEAYETALAMREREFGFKSEKVLETLKEFHQSLTAMNDATVSAATDRVPGAAAGLGKRAEEMARRIADVENYQAQQAPEKNMLVPICLIFSLIFSYYLFGPKGYLTEKAMNRLKKRIDSNREAAAREDVERLISIYKQRKDKELAEQYELLLKR